MVLGLEDYLANGSAFNFPVKHEDERQAPLSCLPLAGQAGKSADFDSLQEFEFAALDRFDVGHVFLGIAVFIKGD